MKNTIHNTTTDIDSDLGLKNSSDFFLDKNKNKFDQILDDIQNLKIQGAINVALKSIEALNFISKKMKKKSDLKNYIKALISTRSTEPAMKNLLFMYYENIDENLKNTDEVFRFLDFKTTQAKKTIAQIGARQIKDGMTIFTHCSSSTVLDSLFLAFDQGKNFTVMNTETRPKFQGRKTAKKLTEHGIKTIHMVDNSVYKNMRKADVFMIGADAVNSIGNVYNKIGSHVFCELAKNYDLRTLVLSNAIKYDPETEKGKWIEVENRHVSEVWEYENENLTILNPAFDEIEKEVIDGIISEWGILSPPEFTQKARQTFKVFDLEI